MTEKRALKQAIRERMGETGEKYTEARRAILGRLEVDHRVFKRLTADARRVVAMATDEARILKHSYVGTEHILLGLLREQNGVAAQALDALGITDQRARARVVRIVGFGEEVGLGQKPFTPRAISVFELWWRTSGSCWKSADL